MIPAQGGAAGSTGGVAYTGTGAVPTPVNAGASMPGESPNANVAWKQGSPEHRCGAPTQQWQCLKAGLWQQVLRKRPSLLSRAHSARLFPRLAPPPSTLLAHRALLAPRQALSRASALARFQVRPLPWPSSGMTQALLSPPADLQGHETPGCNS